MMEKIIHDIENHRFYLKIEGKESYLKYVKEGNNTLNFASTYVPTSLRGRGIAEQLVRKGFEFARENNYKVYPSCSYVDTFMRRYTEYNDLLSD